MLLLKLTAVLFAIAFGVPNKIIDYKHRKNKAYEPGNAWAYYAALSKQGSWEGRYMMWSGYAGIGVIVAVLAYLAYRLFTT